MLLCTLWSQLSEIIFDVFILFSKDIFSIFMNTFVPNCYNFIKITGLTCLIWQASHKRMSKQPIKYHQKSDNLQYNMLGWWVAGTIVSLTKCLMFQVLFFFIISCQSCVQYMIPPKELQQIKSSKLSQKAFIFYIILVQN